MTVEEVRRRVTEILDCSDDNEQAHSYEDQLHADVLASIGLLSTDPWAKEIARVALETLEIEYQRWYA